MRISTRILQILFWRISSIFRTAAIGNSDEITPGNSFDFLPARREADGSQTFYYMCELKNCQMCNVNGNVLDKLLCDEIMNFNKLSTSI